MINKNLFAALRDAFPAELDGTAIETADGPASPRFYTWRDIDRASARIANLLGSLRLRSGSRVAVQTEKSVEALMLYLAVLRAGFVYLPLMHAEDPAVADRSVAAYRALAADPAADDGVRAQLAYAERHRDLVVRFGRYPGRNPALGRPDTPEEVAWLAAGGETFGAR